MLTLFNKLGDPIKISEEKDLNYKIDKYALSINTAPSSEDGSCLLYFSKSVQFGNITIPTYSRGILINMYSADAAIIAIDSAMNLYACFRNNMVWYGRKI